MSPRARKRVIILLSAVGVLSAGGAGAYFLRQMQIQRASANALAEGNAAFEAQEYPEAMRKLGSYVGRNPTDGEAMLKLARARREVPMENARHLSRAAEIGKQAASLRPDDKEPLEFLLDVYRDLGMLTERLDTADKLLAINPKHREALIARVQGLAAKGQRADALKAAQELAAAYADDPAAHESVVHLMQLAGRTSDELRAYAESVSQKHPEKPSFLMLASRVAAMSGDLAAARERAADAADLPTESAEQLSDLMRLLDLLDMRTKADELLAREAKNARSGSAVAAIAVERAWKEGRLPDARDAAAPILSSIKDAPAHALGWAALAQESAAVAPVLDELRSRDTERSRVWVQLIEGRDALNAGQTAAAREKLTSVVGDPLVGSIATFFLARADDAVGEWRSAVDRLRDVAGDEPRWVVPRLAAVDILRRNGQLEEARREARAAVDSAPFVATVVAYARITADLSDRRRVSKVDLDETIKLVDRAMGTGVGLAELQAVRARLTGGRSPDNVQELINSALTQTPPAPAGDLLALAASARSAGSPNFGALIDLAMKTYPDNPDVRLTAAVRAASEGRADEGKTILREGLAAARAKADNADAVLAMESKLAAYLESLQDPEGAELFIRIAEQNEGSASAQIALLESSVASTNEPAARAAIGRLRRLGGESAAQWRVFEARRVLTFDRSQASAAGVVTLLADVMRTDPNNADAQALTAEAMLLLGDPTAAAQNLTRALEAEPGAIGLYPPLIALLKDAGRTQEARLKLEEFAGVQQLTPALRRRRAELLASLSMWDRAEADLSALAAENNPADLVLRARLLVARGRGAEAEPLVEAMLATTPVIQPAAVFAAEYYATRGDADRGLEVLRSHLSPGPENDDAVPLAEYLRSIGRPDDALAALRASAAGSTRTAVLIELSRAELGAGRFDDALAAAERAKAGDAARAEVLIEAVRGAREAQLATDSLRALASALANDVNRETVATITSAMRTLNTPGADLTAVTDRLQSLTRTKPRLFLGWQLLAAAYATRGDVVEAARAAQSAMTILASDPRPAELATGLLFSARRPEEALGTARQWRERSLANPYRADVAIGRAELMLGRPADALRTLAPMRERMVRTDDLDAVGALALALAASDREDQAHELIWPMINNRPEWVVSYLDVARALAGRPDVARLWLQRAAPLCESPAILRVQLARSLFELAGRTRQPDDFTAVLTALGPALDDSSTRVPAAMLAAASNEQLGKFDDAERLYRVVVADAPGYAPALNNLAYLLITRGTAVEEAAELARRAVQLAKDARTAPAQLVPYLGTLGEAELSVKKYSDAETVFREALVIQPEAPGLILGLAIAMAEQGRPEEARETLRRLDRLTLPTDERFTERLSAFRLKLQPVPGGG